MYAWSVQNMTTEKKEEFDDMLNAPLEGQRTTETNDPRKFTDDQAADDFAAAMAQFGAGA